MIYDDNGNPSQWEMVFNLPADGQTYRIEGVAWRAKHCPATKIQCEQVVVDSGSFGILRRRHVKGKWQATDYINSY